MRSAIFKKILYVIYCTVLLTLPSVAFGSEREDLVSFGQYDEYGSIFGAEYDPENGNTSKWLTIKPGENGVRIINDDNTDIFMVDKYGGIYINGQLYVNGEEYVQYTPEGFSPENGFLYFLIIISLCFNIFLYRKVKKIIMP
ncbi:MAG: hypothetical protein HFG14_12400 [Lachnospiraceae bacterium]|jgi:hypothetical protein|nr:hypothetical protein [Lachnospiraceae bacterium]NBJ83213.1 hypothetical protein [bacterium 1XD42-76]NBK06626.1 hypothetical protein [bacterium 1XD42-94]